MTENPQNIRISLTRQNNGQAALRDQWTDFREATRLLLEQVAESAGEETAQRVARAIALECDYLRNNAYEPRIEKLQLRLEDVLIVLEQREDELRRLKATKPQQRIAMLEKRCAQLQIDLDRKPADEAAERTALVEAVLFSGEKIGFQALYDDNGVL